MQTILYAKCSDRHHLQVFSQPTREQFVKRHNYTATPKYDDNVEPFRGSLLTEKSRAVLARHFDEETIKDAAVYLYFCDNSDVQCPRTYKVEIGLPNGHLPDSHGGRSTMGVFGSSGSACTELESAFEQAAINLIMKLFVVPPLTNMVAYRHRV
jgi:hypothetical protein